MTQAANERSTATVTVDRVAPLDRLLFYLLLAVLAARPLIGETYQRLEISFLTALEPTGGPTPAATAALDSILLAASTLALARAGRWRRHKPAAVGILLLAAAVYISSLTCRADRSLALLAGWSLVIGVLAGLALAALLQSGWMLRLLLAALLATGITTAIRCIGQKTYELEQTRQLWQEHHKPRLLRLGYDPDDPLLINFERRLLAGEAHGFLGHPNLTASCLAMWLLVVVGLTAGRLRERGRPDSPQPGNRFLFVRPHHLQSMLAELLIIVLAAALWFTGSLGAMLAGSAALALLLFLGFAARWSARQAKTLLAVLAGAYLALVAAAMAYGLAKGTLPHPSLAFRWHYWTAAGRAFRQAPLTGIGRENFATAYTQYKPAESTEEVRNPHNLWVSLLVELGPLGLVGGALLSTVCMLAGLRRLTADIATGPPHELGLTHMAPLICGVLPIQAFFSGTSLREPGSALLWIQEVGLIWSLSLITGCWLLRSGVLSGTGACWLRAGLCAALAASLLHALLDFALLTPAGLAVFALCAAAAGVGKFGHPQPSTFRPTRPWQHLVPFAIAAALVVEHYYRAARVPTRGSAAQRRLDAVLHAGPLDDGLGRFGLAAEAAARSGEASVQRAAARAAVQVSRWRGLDENARLSLLEDAQRYAALAACTNPCDSSNYSLLAAIAEELAELHRSTGRLEQARQAQQQAASRWEQAVRLYPTNPRTRIRAARAWLAFWQETRDADAAQRACRHLQMALWIDDQRPPQDTIRLSAKQRQEIEDYLRQLNREALSTSSSSSVDVDR